MTVPTIGWLGRTLETKTAQLPNAMPLGPISIDSRTLTEGDTFWALRGTRDGHDYVPDAFAKGAKAAVVEEQWADDHEADSFHGKLIVARDSLDDLTNAARAWRKECTFDLLGITGSNGKTSTKEIILQLLSLRYRTAGTEGNLNNHIGVPLTILALPKETQVAVVEMGASHVGEIAHLCSICLPNRGLVTSISAAHLEGFGTIENVAKAKGELYDFVADSGFAFVPTDDSRCPSEATECRKKIGYGFDATPDDWTAPILLGSNLNFDESGRASFRFEGVSFSAGIPGKGAALAALAALTVARTFGIDPSDCVEAIKNWRGARGRSEVIQTGEISIIDDTYNANPESMRAALNTLQRMNAVRRVAILGDMNELGTASEEEHRALGRAIGSSGLSLAILVGTKSKLAADEIAKSRVPVRWFSNYGEMEVHLPDLIKAHDTVLVKASRSEKLERAVEFVKKTFA